MIGGVAAAAAVRTFPFRVFSFPTDLRIANDWAYPTCIFPQSADAMLAQVQALELENFHKEIPVLLSNDQTLYRLFNQRRTIEVYKWNDVVF